MKNSPGNSLAHLPTTATFCSFIAIVKLVGWRVQSNRKKEDSLKQMFKGQGEKVYKKDNSSKKTGNTIFPFPSLLYYLSLKVESSSSVIMFFRLL